MERGPATAAKGGRVGVGVPAVERIPVVQGIYWCLGRYDRPWGPARPIFGKIRFMSSANTARKLALVDYLERFGVDTARGQPKRVST